MNASFTYRRWCSLGTAVVALLLFIQPASAQTSAEPRYTFVVLHTPLAEALNRLIQETQINLVFPSDLVEGRMASCRVEAALVEQVLGCIVQDTGLDFVRLSSGTYVLKEAPQVEPARLDLMGQVLDQSTGQPLAYAHIMLDGDERGTITNEAGRFAFADVLPGQHRIRASYLGYRTQAASVSLDATSQEAITLALEAEPLLAAPIVVNGLTRRLPAPGESQAQQTDLAPLPTASTADAVASLNTIIGVQTGDALAEVHVQGGDAGEHQFKLDGATVFAPIRVGGLVGPFSPFALRKITVRKAGFGVEHGSHLSGIIQAEHTLQGIGEERIIVQADPISLNGRVNGVLNWGTSTSWMVAGRIGQWGNHTGALATQLRRWSAPDPFLFDAPLLVLPPADTDPVPSESDPVSPLSFDSTFANNEAQKADLFFTDIHAALHTRFTPTRSLRASLYQGRSVLQGTVGDVLKGRPIMPPAGTPDVPQDELNQAFSSSDQYEWQNTVGQVAYEWVMGRTTFASVGGWASRYTLTHPFDFFFSDITPFLEENEEEEHEEEDEDENEVLEEDGFEDRNRVHEVGLKAQIHHAWAARHLLTGGFESIYTNSAFSITIPLFTNGPGGQQIEFGALNGWRGTLFANDRVDLGAHTVLDLGTRLTYLPTHHTVYAEPRLALRHDHVDGRGRQWVFRGAAGLYRQYLQQLDVATYQINALAPSYRFWMPLNGSVRPPQAYHLSTAVLFMPSSAWQFEAEGYYKHQPHLLVIDYATLIQRTDSLALTMDTFLRSARGYAYGAGLTVTHNTPRLRLQAQYEYSIAQRSIANRFDGRLVVVPWHAPHRLNVRAEYQLSKRFVLSLRGTHVYGRAWAFRQAYYDFFAPHAGLQHIGTVNFSNPEEDRLPAYIQWDAGLAFTTTLRRATVQARLYAMNVAGRNNVGDRSLQLMDAETPTLTPVDRPLTPFFPSFTLRLSW